MTLELMRFWFFSGTLLAGAAWSLETLLRGRGVQLRGIWAGAMGLTFLSPVLPRPSWMAPASGGVEPPLGGIATVDPRLLELAAQYSADLVGPAVLAAWAALSLGLVVTGALLVRRLGRRAELWRASHVRGEAVLVAPDFGPAVVGVVSPRIVLPEDLVTTDQADLDLILRHEREHIEARDPWLLLGAAGLVALMPWNLPLVWQALRLRSAVEEDCDTRVLRAGACKRSYGELLIRMAARPPHFGLATAALSEDRSGLARRLKSLGGRRGTTRVAVTALLVIAGATAIGVWMGVPSPVGDWLGASSDNDFEFGPAVPEAPAVAPLPPLPPVAPLADDIDVERIQAEYRAALKVHESALRRAQEALERVERRSSRRMTSAERLEFEAEQLALVDQLRRAERALEEVSVRRMRDVRLGAPDSKVATPKVEMDADRIRIVSSDGPEPIVFVNGRRLLGGLDGIDRDQIDRIEVIKGEAAIGLHGPDGVNGVINVYLKKQGSGRN